MERNPSENVNTRKTRNNIRRHISIATLHFPLYYAVQRKKNNLSPFIIASGSSFDTCLCLLTDVPVDSTLIICRTVAIGRMFPSLVARIRWRAITQTFPMPPLLASLEIEILVSLN